MPFTIRTWIRSPVTALVDQVRPACGKQREKADADIDDAARGEPDAAGDLDERGNRRGAQLGGDRCDGSYNGRRRRVGHALSFSQASQAE